MPYPVAAARGRTYIPPVAGNGLLNNLVAFWGLDEAGGANDALDKHSNGLTLTQTNSPGSDTGKVYSGARVFNGSSQYFISDSADALNFGDTDFTVAAWVYLSSTSGDRHIVNRYGGANSTLWQYMLRWNGSVFRWIVVKSGGLNAGEINSTFSPVSTNTWYLVLAYHDAANDVVGISINNGAANTAATNGSLQSTTEPTRIGYCPSVTGYLSGRIGPVMMWKSAGGNGGVLTSAQRTALWNSGNGLAYASFTT